MEQYENNVILIKALLYHWKIEMSGKEGLIMMHNKNTRLKYTKMAVFEQGI